MKIIKIICKRKVETNCYEALMNIGKEESRPELMSVLKLAEEQGGTIIPKNISEHLLGGRPETLGEQIIYRLVEIGVLESTSIDGEYRLTNLGNQTIESEKILIPERGVYKVWFSEDPLFPSGLVGIQYSNPPDLRQEVRKMNEAYKNGKEIDEKLINIENLKIIENNRHIIVIGDDDLRSGTSIFIYQLGEKGYRRNKDDRDLNFVLNIAPDNKTQLTVGAENDRVSIPSTEIDFNELMSIIIDSYRGEWSDEFLDISDLDELDTVSRRGFTLKKVEMNEIELLSLDDEESLGLWNIIVLDIPIDTTNDQIAEEWALWLLKNDINQHTRPIFYNTSCRKIIEKFTHGVSIELPSQQEFAKEALKEGNTELFWYLQSTLDLNPGGIL